MGMGTVMTTWIATAHLYVEKITVKVGQAAWTAVPQGNIALCLNLSSKAIHSQLGYAKEV